jgi:hypothetical protein
MGVVGAITAVASLAVSVDSAKKAEGARKEADAQGRVIQSEQKANNAAAMAQERRKSLREERVRRGRIMQASEASGVEGSSGEFGALGALGTNLATNMGANVGAAASGERTGNAMQSQSDAMSKARSADQMFNFSSSIFQSVGGFGAIANGFNASPSSSTSNIPKGVFKD